MRWREDGEQGKFAARSKLDAGWLLVPGGRDPEVDVEAAGGIPTHLLDYLGGAGKCYRERISCQKGSL